MKAGRVLELLQISRPTLKRYREHGYLRAVERPSKQFDYNADDVFRMMNKNLTHRLTLTYSRVSTYHQTHDLAHQKEELKQFAVNKGYEVDYEFSEIGSGLTFSHRTQFFKMLDLVTAGKVERIIITHKDRLSRVAFNMFEHLFNNFDTRIEVVDDELNPKTDKEELFEEIISLLHCFAMRAYSSRQNLGKEIGKEEKHVETAGSQTKDERNHGTSNHAG